jgi:hypothetical protein
MERAQTEHGENKQFHGRKLGVNMEEHGSKGASRVRLQVYGSAALFVRVLPERVFPACCSPYPLLISHSPLPVIHSLIKLP